MDRSNQTAAGERAPRCEHTNLTKPECHCPSCLAEQVSAHAPQAAQHGDGVPVGGAARG
jgi:hypothetical protein